MSQSATTSPPNAAENRPAAKPPARQSPAKATQRPPSSKPAADYKTLLMDELERALDASPDGLSQAEAARRLGQCGPNELTEQQISALRQFLGYFWGPIPWMIEAAVILSAVDGHWPDFFIILTLLVANAIVGFWEEHQAGNAVAALKAKLALNARVRRDGQWVTPASRELVPGDVYVCDSATSYRPMRGCSTAMRSSSTSRR